MPGPRSRLFVTGAALLTLLVVPENGLAKTCGAIPAGSDRAHVLDVTATRGVSCSVASAIVGDFWNKRGRTKRQGSPGTEPYFTLKAWKKWRCRSTESTGSCHRGARRASYALAAAPTPVLDLRPAVGGAPAKGAAETAALLAGIPQRGLELGNEDAPVTIVSFLDLQCPFCAAFELNDQPALLRDLVRTGKAKLRMAPLALVFMGEDSEAARTVAVRLAARNHAWDFVDLFARNQGQEQTGYVTNDFLLGLVAAIPGTTMSDADRIPDAAIKQTLREADALTSKLDVLGTPSFAVGPSSKAPSTYRLVEPRGDQTVPAAIAAAVAKAG